MKILITGSCGFIGHHFVEHILANTDWEIVGIDKLTYASNGFNRIRHSGALENKRLTIHSADFIQPITCGLAKEIGSVDYLVHIGAETHVDNSIKNPEPFVYSNVIGTMRILDYAKTIPSLKRMIYFSTDEVFGPAPDGVDFKENDRLNPTNPYAAAKAGGEMLCLSYGNTYGIPVSIINVMNAFGERQHPEKFIPLAIKKILAGDRVIIHSDPTKTRAGSRFYIHCRNISAAVLFLLDKAKTRERYNVVGEKEVSNLDMAKFIAGIIGKPLKYDMVDFHSSRPGHDLRYALDGTKLNSMGFHLPKSFEESLAKTIRWYLDHRDWLDW